MKYFLGGDFCLILLTLEDSPCFLIVCHTVLSGGKKIALPAAAFLGVSNIGQTVLPIGCQRNTVCYKLLKMFCFF